MRNVAAQTVYELAREDASVLAVAADVGHPYYTKVKEECPGQYVDFGIAECNMVGASAGMAAAGKIPFLYAVTNFLSMRAYEFLRNLVCVPAFNVKLLGRSAGLVTGTYGITHQGTEELALLRALPNLITITPATPIEARESVRFAYRHQGPVYIRLEGYNEPEYYSDKDSFQPGMGHTLRDGRDVTIVTIGSIVNEALQAADALERKGISVRVLSLSTIFPIDRALILRAARETRAVFTLEEHSIYGGLGSSVAEVLAEGGVTVRFRRMGLKAFPKGCGNRESMRIQNGLSARHVIDAVMELRLQENGGED